MHISLNEFIAITQRVVARDGFDDYMPTLVLPARRHIMALEGIPDTVDTEAVARKWAEEHAGGGDFLLAFKIDARRFKAIERKAGEIEARVVVVRDA